MDATRAKAIIRTELEARRLPFARLTSRTVGFSDLARESCVFVTVHGWGPNPQAEALETVARSHGFRVTFNGGR